MKIATSLYDFSGLCKDEFDRIRAASKTKFKYYNIGGMYYGAPSVFEEEDALFDAHVDKIGETLDECGVKIIMAHSPNLALKTEEEFEASVAMVKRRIRACGKLGIPDLVQHCFGTSNYTNGDFYRENKRFMERLFDDMEKYNVHVLTENMDYSAHAEAGRGRRTVQASRSSRRPAKKGHSSLTATQKASARSAANSAWVHLHSRGGGK